MARMRQIQTAFVLGASLLTSVCLTDGMIRLVTTVVVGVVSTSVYQQGTEKY